MLRFSISVYGTTLSNLKHLFIYFTVIEYLGVGLSGQE